MLENIAFFVTKRETIRPIVIIVSGGSEEKPCCPKIFVWDRTTYTRSTLGARVFQSTPYLGNALHSIIRNIKTMDTFKTADKTIFF